MLTAQTNGTEIVHVHSVLNPDKVQVAWCHNLLRGAVLGTQQFIAEELANLTMAAGCADIHHCAL